MSIRTNRMKAVPSLQKRLTSIKSKEEASSHIADKLDELNSDLISIKDLFSTVKSNEDELLDTLKNVDDLLRNFQTEKFFHVSHRILHPKKAEANPAKINDQPPSSSQETQDKKSEQKDITIDEKLDNLKSELDHIKTEFFTLKENEELRKKLKEIENFLQNFKSMPAEDATKALQQPSQTSREELGDQDIKATGIDKSPSSQETPEKKSIVEKDMPIDEKFESVKSKLDKMIAMSSTLNENKELRVILRDVEDLLQNFNAKNLPEIIKPTEVSNQSETKSSELPDQTSRDESVDQDLKATGVDESSPNQEPEKDEKKDISIDKMLENLKLELDKMKVKFSTVEENEELRETLRTVEDLLQNFEEKGLSEIAKPGEDANQSETKGSELTSQKSREELEDQGVDKPSPSQEAKDKKSVEKYVLDDEKLESLKSLINNIKPKLSTFKKELLNMLRALEDLLQNTNTKTLTENVKRVEEEPKRKQLVDESVDEVVEAISKKIKESTKKLGVIESETKPDKDEVVDEVVEAISKKIKESTKKLGVIESETKPDKSSDQGKASKTVHYPRFSLSPKHEDVNLVLKRFQASYDALNPRSKVCCLSLSVFPENVVIKKRHIIYWWIGEGFVKKGEKKTAEEEGEVVFDELLNSNLIVAHGKVKSPVVNKFKINPWIRYMLVSSILGENDQPFEFYSQIINPSPHYVNKHACLVLDEKKVRIGGDFGSKSEQWRSVFNVGASYLTIEPQWMAKMNKLVVLQLGRWQESPSHHIEVDSEKFMIDLKAQKHLKYLSLRGISRISVLPQSIAQLVSLEILDLKACHNLETLPNEITSLKKLTHLDVSQCYLLERMPKEIEKLTELQVLKGFVVGSSSKAPKISNLVNLKNLKRLSIHIGSESVIQEGEFENLGGLQVKCLKISWGVLSNTNYKDIQIVLPGTLEKLNLEGFPSEICPEWLKLDIPRGLKRLYITGGKLTSLDIEKSSRVHCKVQILRLKYLKYLQIDLENLKVMFPSLKYVEVKKVSKKSFEWSKKDDESASIS